MFGLQKTRDSLKEAFESLFDKYGREFDDDDEIDILSLEVVKKSTTKSSNIQKPRKFGFLYKKTGEEALDNLDEENEDDGDSDDEMENDPTDLEKIFNERSNALMSVSSAKVVEESTDSSLKERKPRKANKKTTQLAFDFAILRMLELETSMKLKMSLQNCSRPRAALLKSLQRKGDEIVTEETFGAIFDDEMQTGLLGLLDFYKTSHTATTFTIEGLPDAKYTESAQKVAQFTFLAKESLEKSLLKPFFTLNKNVNEGEELISALMNFYSEERIATLQLISWLLNPTTDKSEIIVLCRTALKSLLARGLIEKACAQLVNLSSITLPSSIVKEGRNELSFSWIHQNVLEQKELAKMLFELLSSDFVKIPVEIRSKIVSDLIKSNFGLNNFERYNLDAGTVTLAREAFWFRQAAAIRILDLKGLISASVSSSNIISALNPLKPVDLSKLQASFKSELNHELTSPFKFAWSLLVGFLDSLEIVDNVELKKEYPKTASQCVDADVFKVIFDLLDASNFASDCAEIKTELKSLFKDIYISFLSVFDADRSVIHFPLLTEGFIRIFSNESSLCQEFWYVDSQFPGRTSVLKHWINRFPHDFITLIRLLGALSSGPVCSEIVSDFLSKGFDHIYVERSSDRGNVIEDYDLNAEVYNLTVEKAMEIHSCGVGLVLESGTKGVMMAGFNERPMVSWSVKVSPFHFLLRVLQISQDFSVNFFILELFEKLIAETEGFAQILIDHLEAAAPLFTEPKVNNLPLTLTDLLLFVLEQPNPNALIMSKCLNCLVHFRHTLDAEFFSVFMQISSNIMDGITNVLKRCVYNVEIDGVTFEIFDSVVKFSHALLLLCNTFNQDRPEDCSILLKSLKSTVFTFIIEHVGKWRFVSQTHRIRLLAEVCRLILSIEPSISSEEMSLGRNFALLNAIITLLNDAVQDQEAFMNGKLFFDNGIDGYIYFECLTRAIEHTSNGEGNLAIAEYFGNAHISTVSGPKSPFNIIVQCLSQDFMVLPVLLFFQYVFMNDRFALNVRISRDSLEILSSSMCKWFKNENCDPRVRADALAVLNNTACTRPDIFLFIFGQDEEAFVNFFSNGLSRNVFDAEMKLLTGICSILWTSVAEFTLVINALKRKSNNSLVEKLVKLLSVEWPESAGPVALQIVSSVFEVLAVELCYFNLTQNIPQHISAQLKSFAFEPEKFVKKVSLFQEKFPESYLTFVESFSIFASSCLALQNETDFNRKLLTALVLIIEKLVSNWKGNWEQVEVVCKVLNFGLLQSYIQSGKDCYTLLGNEFYNSLITKLITILSSPIDNDLSVETDERIELVCTTATLLNTAESFNWTLAQTNSLYEMMSSVLTVLRHLLALKSRNTRKVSNYLKLLISGMGALSKSTDLVHFIRREGVLKTIFSLIRNYRDTEALILFTAGLCSKYDFVIEELFSSEILESFILEESIDCDKLLLEFISLLSIIRIRFDSNCAASEKICTVLYGCNVQGRLDALKRLELKKKNLVFLESLLPLLKLLSNSLERPIEAPATEALLTNLSESFLEILLNLVSPDASEDQNKATAFIVSTLLTFSLNAPQKSVFARKIQHLLFPFDHQLQKPSPSQYASALHMIVMSGKTEKDEAVENAKLFLKLTCPESLKIELEKFLTEKKK